MTDLVQRLRQFRRTPLFQPVHDAADRIEQLEAELEAVGAGGVQPMRGDGTTPTKPYAWVYQHEETGRATCVLAQQVEWGWEENNPRWIKGLALYTATPPAQTPPLQLSAREVELLDGMIGAQLDHAKRCDNIPNRAMADKQKGWDMERAALLQKLKAAHGIKDQEGGAA